jgi:hypothetical protein
MNRHLRLCQLLLAVGVIAFVAALALGHSTRAWQAFLLNFVFWTGMAQAGVVFAAAYQVSNAQWSDALRRMGESLGFFLPVSLALFLVMMLFGATAIFSWARTPVPSKAAWLNVPFLTARDFLVLAGLSALSALYVYYSQRPALHASGLALPGRLARWTAGAGSPEDNDRCARRTRTLAPALLIAFGLGYSLLGFDLVMSLDPSWYSTLFGWYFFVSAFYATLALLAAAAALFRKTWNLEAHLGAAETHDLGRLLFGFCLLTGGLFWAQWLVFWYGDLPEEIEYVIHRFYHMPYAPLAWTMTYGAFLVPLVVLLSKKLKRNPRSLMLAATWILVMLWLERYVWIVPSISKGEHAPLVVEALVTLGFAGGFGWGWIAHNRRLPIAALAVPPDGSAH